MNNSYNNKVIYMEPVEAKPERQVVNCENITKKSNINIINNIFAITNQDFSNKNYEKSKIHQYFENNNNQVGSQTQQNSKLVPISSTTRPLGITKFSNFKNQQTQVGEYKKLVSTDEVNGNYDEAPSQQPLLQSHLPPQKYNTKKKKLLKNNEDYLEPNFKIIPNKTGLKILSPIYTISETIEPKPEKSVHSHNRNSVDSNHSINACIVRKTPRLETTSKQSKSAYFNN